MGRKKSCAKKIVWNTDEPNGFGSLVVQFFDSLRAKRFSELTIRQRNSSVHNFFLWLEDRGLTDPREVTRPILERYQQYLAHYRQPDGTPLSIAAIHGRMGPLRVFFRWLTKNNYLLSNPAADLELPRRDKRLPRHILSIQEVETIMGKPDLKKPQGLRDRAMLETFYATGIRRKELNDLKIHDVNVNREAVLIREGKGRRDRMIPISERALAWINKYLLDGRPKLVFGPDDGTLFLRVSGKPVGVKMLTEIVTAYVKSAGVKNGSCHMFRHTMATHMLEGGADIRYIQHILGHALLATTEVYTQVSMRKLKEVYDSSHPGAKLKRMGEESPKVEDHEEKLISAEELLSILAAEEKEEDEENK